MKNKIYTVSFKLSKGSGVTNVILNRAKHFASDGYKTGILNFDDELKTEKSKAKFVKQNRLTNDTDWINIFQFYSDKNTVRRTNLRNRIRRHIGLKRQSEVKTLNHDGMIVKHHRYDRKGNLRQVITHSHETGDVKTIERFTPDGFCYLVSEKKDVFTLKLNSRKGQSVQFSNVDQFHTHWLNEIAKSEADRPFIIFDRKEIALSGVDMEPGVSHNIQILHSSHLTGPTYTDVDKIKKSRSPLLSRLGEIQNMVVLTHDQKKDIISKYGDHGNITVIPNSYRQSTSVGPVTKNLKKFIMVARLTGEKQVSHAIKAMHVVVQKYPDAVLEICGEGVDRDSLQKNIHELGLDNNVKLVGHKQIEELDRSYKESLACIMTSNFEGLPLTLLEAMSNGTMVISYDLKYGPSEIVKNNSTGYLVPKQDIEKLASKMKYVLKNPDRAIKMGEKSQKHAESNFDEKLISNKWLDLFDRILNY